MNLLLRNLSIIAFIILITSCAEAKQEYICNPNYESILEEYDYKTINQEWLAKDIVFYKKLYEICFNTPSKIERIIDAQNFVEHDLGNDYLLKKGSLGKGYVTMYYEFVFKRDSLIAYKLDLPEQDILLLEKYNLKPQEIFEKGKDHQTGSNDFIFIYGLQNVNIPLNNNIPEIIKNEKLQYYMSPFSGIEYGCRGGYTGSVLKNRCAFKHLIYQNQLTYEELLHLLNAINLASRLTAIEYYTNTKAFFSSEQEQHIEDVIEKIFLDYGDKKISVLVGDIGLFSSIEDAVNLNLENDCW